MELPVYLDNASTTPLDPRVVEAMLGCLRSSDSFGNPSADTHELGRNAHALVEAARDQVAALINATSGEIIWTSGATESECPCFGPRLDTSKKLCKKAVAGNMHLCSQPW